MNQTLCLDDYSFGPQTSPQCRDGLDLTLVFEESILSLLPASLMIIGSTARCIYLSKSRRVVPGKSFYDNKALHLTVLVILRFVLLLLWSIRRPVRTSTSIAAASVFLVESFAFVALSRSEHVRSVRPSSLLNLYYLFSLGLDVIRIRTLVKLNFDNLITSLCAADMAIKLSLLFLEAQNKRIYFSPTDSGRPPQEISGILNRSVFWWLNSLFFQGYREILTLNDLFPLDDELSSEDMFAEFESEWNRMSNVSSYRLGRTIVLCLRKLFFAPVIPNLLLMPLIFAQPFLVTALLNYISSSDSKELGYLIVAGYAADFILKAICTAFYTHQLDRFVTMLRGCLVNIIYNQTLKLDMKEAAGGESLTLMSADVEHIVKGFGQLHEASSNGVMTIVALGLLYRQLGLSFLAPLIFSAVLSYLNGSGSGPYIQRQKEWLEATEQRVGFTSSIISSMKGVKILGLVEKINSRICSLRHTEVEKAKRVRIFYAIFTLLQTLSQSGTRWITYTTFGIVTLLSSSRSGLNTSVLFTSLTILNIFMERLEIFLRYMPSIASSFGCLRRIENFLLLETKRDNRLVGNAELVSSDYSDSVELREPMDRASGNVVVSMKELSIGWTRENVVVQGLSMEIPQGNLTMVIGPVGSGKSTLMHALLGETITHKGFLSVASTDSIAFCSQTPWLINRSIQENILGTSMFDAPWYLEVLKSCALLEDLRNYPAGDRTLIGSKGITLSGGQKQRIALARAVYARKSIVILDDIFSGLDPITENIIFQSLFGSSGILRRESQTVILATHAVHLLSKADGLILLGNNKDVLYQGDYLKFPTELVTRSDLHLSSSTEPAHAEKVGPKVILTERSELVETDIEIFEPRFHPIITDVLVSPDAARQSGDSKIYKYYLKTFGFKHLLLFFFLGAVCMGGAPAQSLWLNAWSENTDNSKIGYYLGIFSIFFVAEISLTALWIWHVLIYPLSASSIRLHNIQLEALMSATMAFFSSTDTGVTTNRFSQDIMLIDSELPLGMIDFVEYVYNCLYKIILIGVSSAYIVPIFPFLLLAFWLIQRFYLRTSRQVRFLDLETKAPLYTHFIETLAGLATIRGFGWEANFEEQNRAFLQNSQRPFFFLATIQRWLTMVLDLIVSALGIILAILAVELRDSINPGFLGLALVNVMALGLSLEALVSFWTGLETSIGAVSRIKSFSQDTPSEDPLHLSKATKNWLHSGRIEFSNISASHGPDSVAVLRDINLCIAPGEHIGICGRSGSGKSSLLAVLLRIMSVPSGSVHIDGLDISSIPPNQVRASLNTLSQESFFLPGTIRENLITASSAPESDERLQAVLTRTGLWNKVQSIGGLDTVLDAGELFSHGERQLFCLARALLNPSNILILDEFTSNVDIETDRAMQKIIREDFKNKTIIAVAHRLETIFDFDRIVVLDQGAIVEQGSPRDLLERSDVFRGLYDAYTKERGASPTAS